MQRSGCPNPWRMTLQVRKVAEKVLWLESPLDISGEL